MNPQTLTIQGIGPHSETTIDLTRFPRGVVAICGPTGTGKTRLTASIPGALYGSHPISGAVVKSMKGAMTNGRSEKSTINFKFEHRGISYLIEREILPSGGHNAWMSVGNHKRKFGPKVGDVEREVVLLFGSEDEFLATGYQARESRNDLINCLPSERKEQFGKFLAFEELNATSKRMSDAAKEAEAQAELLEGQLVGNSEADFQKKIAQSDADFFSHNLLLQSVSAAVCTHQDSLEAARKMIRDASGGEDVLRGQIATHNEALDAETRMRGELRDLRGEIEALEARAKFLPEADKATAEIKTLREKIAGLRKQEESFRVFHAWRFKLADLEGKHAAKVSVIEAMESAPGLDAETKALAGKIDALREEYRAAKELNEKNAAALKTITLTLASLDTQVSGRESLVYQLKSRIAKKPDTPGAPEVCAVCPLLKEFANLPMELQRAEGELELARAKRTDYDTTHPTEGLESKDLTEIIQRGEAAKGAKALVDAAATRFTQLEEARRDSQLLAVELEQHRNAKPEEVADPAQDIRDNQRQIDSLTPVAARLESASQAGVDATAKRGKIIDLEAKFVLAQERTATTKMAAEEAKRSLDNRAINLRELQTKEAAAVKAVEEARAESTRLTSEIARCGVVIEHLQKDLESFKVKRADAHERRKRADDLRFLQVCFGPKGFQPMAIDSFLPALDTIIDDVLSQMTDGKMCMRYATQKARDDGSIAEGFSIIVNDSKGQRDVSECSGGESSILQAANRIGLCLWLAQLKGTACETLVIDEACNNLDDDASVRFLEAIQNISHLFARIILVSPKSEVARLCPMRIELAPTFSGVSVEYIGATQKEGVA